MPVSQSDQVRRSNIVFNWKSDIIKIDGTEWEGIKGISYSEKLERKIVHANKRDGTPVGMTPGKYTLDAVSISMLRSTSARLKQYLAAKSGVGSHGAVEFTIDVQHVAPNQDVVAATLAGLRWTSNKRDDKEGVDELVEDIEFMGLYALETLNGEQVSLFTEEDQS